MPTENPLLLREKAVRKAERLRQQRASQSQAVLPLPPSLASQTAGGGPSNAHNHLSASQATNAGSFNVSFPIMPRDSNGEYLNNNDLINDLINYYF